jgi:putative transcriptional regulator
MQILITRIRELRAIEGITQEELADRVGVVRQTIAYLERGEYMPSLHLAWRIAQVFNKKIDEVFTLESN